MSDLREQPIQIYVDADACPVVGIVEKIAERYRIPVTLLCDTNHVLRSNYSEVIIVGAGADAVDYKLIGICHMGDIVVSQDGKARRGSHKNHIKGPKKRTKDDDERFAQSFEKMVQMAINKNGAKDDEHSKANY